MKKGGAAKGELVLAIYELANSFRHGWGVGKDPVAARSYYETAANLGDTDAMNEVARCYEEGFGGKKDRVSGSFPFGVSFQARTVVRVMVFRSFSASCRSGYPALPIPSLEKEAGAGISKPAWAAIYERLTSISDIVHGRKILPFGRAEREQNAGKLLVRLSSPLANWTLPFSARSMGNCNEALRKRVRVTARFIT